MRRKPTDSAPRRRRTALAVALAAVLAATALAACGGEDTSETGVTDTEPAATGAAPDLTATEDGATEDAEAVSAEEWVASVCTAISDWQTEVAGSAPDLSNVTDIESTRQSLSDYLGEVSSATDEMVAQVEGAGVPDVESGEEIAQGFQENLASVGDSFDQARADLESLSTDDPQAFAAGLEEIGTTLSDAGAEAGRAFDELATEYPDSGLDEAAANAPECAPLEG